MFFMVLIMFRGLLLVLRSALVFHSTETNISLWYIQTKNYKFPDAKLKFIAENANCVFQFFKKRSRRTSGLLLLISLCLWLWREGHGKMDPWCGLLRYLVQNKIRIEFFLETKQWLMDWWVDLLESGPCSVRILKIPTLRACQTFFSPAFFFL